MARNSGDYTAVDINGINHTDKAINYTHINGYGGPNIGPFGDGGGYCCVMLPDKWHCGLTVHFLSCNQIKVTTVCQKYGTPNYPIKEPREMKEPATCPAK